MTKSKHFQTLLTLAVLVLFCTLPVFAQDNKVITEGAVTLPAVGGSSTTPNLALNDTEKAFLKSLSDRLTPIQSGMADNWKRFLATDDEKEAINIWLRVKLLDVRSGEINRDFLEWFEGVKKAHNCPGCSLDNYTLVLPKKVEAPAASTPTATPKKP